MVGPLREIVESHVLAKLRRKLAIHSGDRPTFCRAAAMPSTCRCGR
jgi:hypothetical protein